MAPEDAWYILPEKLIRGMVGMGLNPKSTGSQYDRYKEAWCLLRGEKPGVIEINACAEYPAPQIHFSAVNHSAWAAPFVLAAHFLRWRLARTFNSLPLPPLLAILDHR